jgi:hypothetical protein
LVDRTDLAYTLSAIQEALGQQALSFFGEGVLATTQYPVPFPVSLSGTSLGGTVGAGIAYDPSGNYTAIESGTTTPQTFTNPAADTVNPRYDLLVITYFQTGDTPIPKPSDPIMTIDLNLHDDFALAIRPGTAAATPAYPAKQPGDIILGGIQVPAGAMTGAACVFDQSIREMAEPYLVSEPVFKPEVPAGAVNGSNAAFTLSALPYSAGSVLLTLDGVKLEPGEFSVEGQALTLFQPPAVGQSLVAWYIEYSPTSVNPLFAVQPALGIGNGAQTVFPLPNQPSQQAAILLFKNGRYIPTTDWSLMQNPTQSSVVFNFAPEIASSISCLIFYNAVPTAMAPSVSSGSSMGGYTAFGSASEPVTISGPSGLVPTTAARQVYFVQSSGGAVPVTATPQIAAGSTVGQELLLMGLSDTNYPIFVDGNGLSLNGPININSNASILLVWNGLVWQEDSRR